MYMNTLFQIHLTSAQFPDHVDLQKVSEIIFNNEKFNVLKPTVHKITDHFKDFVRREIKNNNERVFVDDNGFRHFWSGLGMKQSSLRKTEIEVYEVNKVIEDNVNVDNISPLAKKSLKRPEALQENKNAEAILRHAATTAKPAAKKKKVAITSFFCPFFGVMKMTSFID